MESEAFLSDYFVTTLKKVGDRRRGFLYTLVGSISQ
jgi:hypothetical protein